MTAARTLIPLGAWRLAISAARNNGHDLTESGAPCSTLPESKSFTRTDFGLRLTAGMLLSIEGGIRSVQYLAEIHEDANVRFAVACALGKFADDPRAVQALIALTGDCDEDVRDWATFALGVLGDADSSEIRAALLKRIDDPNPDVREEALVALANRKESRAILTLVTALNHGTVNDRLREAAESFLGESKQHETWDGYDFAKALSLRFPS